MKFFAMLNLYNWFENTKFHNCEFLDPEDNLVSTHNPQSQSMKKQGMHDSSLTMFPHNRSIAPSHCSNKGIQERLSKHLHRSACISLSTYQRLSTVLGKSIACWPPFLCSFHISKWQHSRTGLCFHTHQQACQSEWFSLCLNFWGVVLGNILNDF